MKTGPGTFTHEQAKIALVQIRDVLKTLTPRMHNLMVGEASTAAEIAAGETLEYLERAERQFRGIHQRLNLRDALVFDRASQGARSSILHRLASSGTDTKNADAEEHRAKPGVLQRYSRATMESFEEILQRGIVTKKSPIEIRNEIQAASPFLQGKPASWAQRIVRTETAGSYARGGWEAIREADRQLGDMLKIVVATFDDRTGADSYNVHGEVRRPDEPFEYIDYRGRHELFMHPPNRPNDRESTIPHRLSWPVPDGMKPLDDDKVIDRYLAQKLKYHGRPKLSTVKGL